MTICYSAKIDPIILLTKIDLIESDQVKALTKQINERIKGIPVFPLSIEMEDSFDMLIQQLTHIAAIDLQPSDFKKYYF